MKGKQKVLAICGSASSKSANLKLLQYLSRQRQEQVEFLIFDDLKSIPHFDPEVSTKQPTGAVAAFRQAVAEADGVIICTPEYVFSMPSGLKNVLEWCVATTVFSDKPTGLITASASGQKGHESLLLVMRTIMAKFTDDTTLLIQGVKGKVDSEGNITDPATKEQLDHFYASFLSLLVHTTAKA